MSTVTYISPQEAFDFLVDFPSYQNYTEYLDGVERFGDGTAGTQYHINLSWWKFTYTTKTRVVELTEPERVKWQVIKDVDAHGSWQITDVSNEVEIPDEHSNATRVTLRINYDRSSVGPGIIDLPPFLSLDRVIEKAKGVVVDEGEKVVQRMVADLEGSPRPVEIKVEKGKL